jgi:hypothetical protein
MQTSHQDTAHSLYVLYQALPEESQQLFLQEMLINQAGGMEDAAIYMACQKVQKDDVFLTDAECFNFIDGLPR